MKITIELNPLPSTDPNLIAELFAVAAEIDSGAMSTAEIPARALATPATNAAAPAEGSTQRRGRGRPPSRAAEIAPNPATENATAPTEKTAQDAPLTASIGSSMPAAQAEQAAPVAATNAPPPGVAIPASAPPPGVARTDTPVASEQVQPVQMQQAAMPPAQEASPSGSVSVEDLREAWRQVSNAIGTQKVFNFMRGEKWHDGTPRPKWFTPEAVPPEFCARAMEEILQLT